MTVTNKAKHFKVSGDLGRYRVLVKKLLFGLKFKSETF